VRLKEQPHFQRAFPQALILMTRPCSLSRSNSSAHHRIIRTVRADRPQLARAIAALDQGDILAVTRIDRLARSSRDLLNIVHEVEARGATFESLSEPKANTNTPQASAMLTMLSAFAQLDRAFILARQPTLFGGWSLVREWGRIGCPGTVRIEAYPTRGKADLALILKWAEKQRRSYR